MTISLTDPIVLKGGAGLALYAFGGSRLTRMAGLALAGWAAWQYWSASSATAPKALPLDPDAPMPLQAAATGREPGDPFAAWPMSYTPSVRPARPDEVTTRGKVIPLRPTLEDTHNG